MTVTTPPTDDELKQLIITTVGDVNGIIAANIDLIWSFNGVYAAYPPLQFLYSTRMALDMLAGQVWQQVDAAVDDAREALSDKYKALRSRINDLDDQIAATTPAAMAATGLSVAAGLLATTAPSTPPYWSRDANDPRYIGWVYSVYTSYGWDS